MLLAAQAHLGTKNCDKTMEPYVWKRRADGEWQFVDGRMWSVVEMWDGGYVMAVESWGVRKG